MRDKTEAREKGTLVYVFRGTKVLCADPDYSPSRGDAGSEAEEDEELSDDSFEQGLSKLQPKLLFPAPPPREVGQMQAPESPVKRRMLGMGEGGMTTPTGKGLGTRFDPYERR